MPTPELIQDLPALTVRRTVVSGMENNVYLITEKSSGAQILIDAADDAPAIRELVLSAEGDSQNTPQVQIIGTTHSHYDHIQALSELVASTGARTAAGAPDAASIEEQSDVVIEQKLTQGDQLRAGDVALEAVLLRGHTPGSIAYVLHTLGQHGEQLTLIFSGDSLFPGGVGNTNRDAARFNQLLDDVSQRLFDVYPDSAIVYPGHGAATTLGEERSSLPAWRQRGW